MAIGGIAMLALAQVPSARADQVILNGGYHAQTTDHWCAAASMEMMLDVPAVKNASNLFVTNLLNAGDGPTVATGDPIPTLVGGQVTARGQAFIYGLVHGTNTINNFGYSNTNTPVGAGTANAGIVTGLNLLDNSNANVNPAIPAAGFGTHQYTGFNLAPTLAGAAQASRTMANAMKDFSVPAQATVESGAHSITVYGVSTNGTPGQNQNYTINGFYIHDPWTGYVYNQATGFGNLAPLAAGGWGLGWNTYLRYGYDVRAGGAVTQLPNGVVAPVRLGAWFNYFNPSGPQSGPGSATFGSAGMKFTVEPQGPESIDTGDPLGDGSLPSAPTEGSAINSSTADSDAIGDLAADPTLSTEPGLIGGTFDSADELLMAMPGDTGGEGDWLVPYDGGGGINDVTGAAFIDAETGVIDEATWIDPATDGVSSITLSQLDQMFQDQAQGIHPNDNSVPEPASMVVLLGVGGMTVLRRRRR